MNQHKKKAQHHIPVCYLKNFCIEPPEISAFTRPRKLNVFVARSGNLTSWKKRSLGHNTFTESYLYNLKLNPDDPYKVENDISVIEDEFGKSFQAFSSGDFNNQILSMFSLFTTIMLSRTLRSIAKTSQVWRTIYAHLTTLDGIQRQSEEIDDAIRESIITTTRSGDFLASIHANARIVFNHTSIPFITSDTPVSVRFFNLSDISNLLRIEIEPHSVQHEHYERPFIFFPLSHNIGYISHTVLNSENKEILIFDKSVIKSMNSLQLQNGSDFLVSKKQDSLDKLLTIPDTSDFMRSSYIMKFFSPNERFIIGLNSVIANENMIIVETTDVSMKKFLAGEGKIVSLEIYDKENTIPIHYASAIKAYKHFSISNKVKLRIYR